MCNYNNWVGQYFKFSKFPRLTFPPAAHPGLAVHHYLALLGQHGQQECELAALGGGRLLVLVEHTQDVGQLASEG